MYSGLSAWLFQTIWYYVHSFVYHSFFPKYVLLQISGRLFSDSGPRRSSRLSSDSSVNTNANSTVVSGNGTNNSYKGGSKLNHMAFRTMAIRKGQSWANENIDEGDECLYISLLYCITSFFYMEVFPFANSFIAMLVQSFTCTSCIPPAHDIGFLVNFLLCYILSKDIKRKIHIIDGLASSFNVCLFKLVSQIEILIHC